MSLQCPKCGASIPTENINIQKTLALCKQCNLVFDFGNMIEGRKKKPRKPPEHLQIHEDNFQLALSFRQVFGPGPRVGLAMTALASVLLPLLLILFSMRGTTPPLVWLFSLMTCVFWYTLAVFLTTTTRLTVDSDALEVRSGPLPFPLSDNRIVSTQEIKRVFCEDTVEGWPPGPPGMPAYHVSADLYDGDRIRLVTSLPRNYAIYIAESVEDYLQSENTSDDLASVREMQADTEVGLIGYLSDEQDQPPNAAVRR